MKEEIKEILNNIKIVIDEGHYRATCDIDYEDCKILLDYITNLQEENEKKDAYIKYLEEYNPKYYKGEKYYGDGREDYKSRNEKAIEYIKEYVPIINNNLFTKKHQLERYKEKEKYNEKFINELLNILGGGDEE